MPNQNSTQDPQNAPPGQRPYGPAANDNQNKTDPTQPTGQPAAPSIFPQSDLPPLPSVFQNPPPASEPSGSSAPPETPPLITPSPKKKFGGGRIIATILGLVLLVGGIGAGIVLTSQQQLFQQKASGSCSPACAESDNPTLCGCRAGQTVPPVTTKPPSGGGGAQPPTATAGPAGICGYCNNSGACVACGAGKQDQRECTSDSQCKGGGVAGTVCGNGFCEGGESRVNCPNDCPALGQTGTGVATGKCLSDSACANGYVCKNNACEPGGAAVGGAPTSCTRDCSQSDVVCEPPARKECKTTGVDGTKWCLIQANSPDCSGANPPGGGGGSPTGQCLNVKAYDASWITLSGSQLSALHSGSVVNFCVAGSATAGVFDKAQFKIGATLEPETTTHRTGSTDFCQTYTIGATDTTIDVKAKIHHATLGWFGEAI